MFRKKEKTNLTLTLRSPCYKFLVNSLGFPAVVLEGLPAVLFIRRLSGGLAGLSAGSMADLPAVCRAGLPLYSHYS